MSDERRVWLAEDFNAEPVSGTVLVGVIEWGSDSGEDPAVVLASTVEEIERWYRDTVHAALHLDDADEPPPPADAPHDAIVEWMATWREDATEAWLTIYRRPIP